jgi:hypothetical protein
MKQVASKSAGLLLGLFFNPEGGDDMTLVEFQWTTLYSR